MAGRCAVRRAAALLALATERSTPAAGLAVAARTCMGAPADLAWRRHLQTNTTAAASATPAAASVPTPPVLPDRQEEAVSARGGGGLRSWLRGLLPGGKHLQYEDDLRPAGAPDQAEASTSEQSPEDEELKELERLKDIDLDGYAEHCKKQTASMGSPRVTPGPVKRGHSDYGTYVDMRRVTYLRLSQHATIAGLMTPEEKQRVLDEGDEVIKDKALLQMIADRTGIYIDLEVKDCIKSFLDTRRQCRQRYRYVKEFGKPVPVDQYQSKACERFMQAVEAEEKINGKLAKRDRDNCPLSQRLAWAGAAATCSLTGLKYWECCGKLQDDHRAAAPPRWQTYKPRPNVAYMRSRAETKLRRAYDASKRTRFQEQ